MKAVDGRGEILELGGALFKNNTGYDLKALLIGSEGTLAVITELTLKLVAPPGELLRALVGVEKLEQVLPLFEALRAHTPQLSVFEFFTGLALEKVLLRHPGCRYPLERRHPFYVVLEIEHVERTRELHEEFLLGLLDKKAFPEIVVSQSSAQADEILTLRERIPETLTSMHVLHKNDVSVPVPAIPEFVTKLRERIAREYPGFETVIFGHIGDGNLHVNTLKPESLSREEFFSKCREADRSLFSLVRDYHGSISAEHGVGLLKKEFLNFSRSDAEIALMREIKKVFDPRGILNPGKIF
jgi:FAD/FMN-containing dehydrogenase